MKRLNKDSSSEYVKRRVVTLYQANWPYTLISAAFGLKVK